MAAIIPERWPRSNRNAGRDAPEYAAGTEYATFDDGEMSGGFNPALSPSVKQGLNLVIKVGDITQSLETVAGSGGSIVKGKTEVGGGNGFTALFKDPNGNLISIWAKD
ncbi:MAG: VOC family protein [Bdellovibrionota bacterium]